MRTSLLSFLRHYHAGILILNFNLEFSGWFGWNGIIQSWYWWKCNKVSCFPMDSQQWAVILTCLQLYFTQHNVPIQDVLKIKHILIWIIQWRAQSEMRGGLSSSCCLHFRDTLHPSLNWSQFSSLTAKSNIHVNSSNLLKCWERERERERGLHRHWKLNVIITAFRAEFGVEFLIQILQEYL